MTTFSAYLVEVYGEGNVVEVDNVSGFPPYPKQSADDSHPQSMPPVVPSSFQYSSTNVVVRSE